MTDARIWRRPAFALFAALSTALVAPAAHAQDKPKPTAAAPKKSGGSPAQQAFDEGMKLMDSGNYAEACQKLEMSQRMAAGMGTQFQLAQCYEKLNRLGSAWRNYVAVAAAAQAANMQKRAAYAKKLADALAPRLTKVTLQVSPQVAGLEGLTLTNNGVIVPPAEWGGFVVDAGPQNLIAKAPGKKTWSLTLDATGEGRAITVKLDKMVDAGPEPPPPPPGPVKPVDEGGWSGGEIAGLVVAGTGLAAVGVSLGLGAMAQSRYDESEPHCNGAICEQQGVDIREDAEGTALVSTVLFGVGAGALVGGVLAFALSPSGSSDGDAPDVTAIITPDRVGAQWRTTW